MNRDAFLEVLKEKSMAFSEKEIHEMIDAELEKSPEEMDTDFIDLCLDVLDGKYGGGYYLDSDGNKNYVNKTEAKEDKDNKSKNRKIKFGKILLIAAIVSTIFACSMTVGAKLISVNASDNLVDYRDNHFIVDLKQDKNVDDLVGNLSDDGMDKVVLPSAILSDEYVISNYTCTTKVSFDFQDNKTDIDGNVVISVYDSEYDFSAGSYYSSDNYYAVDQINHNNLEILIIQSPDYITIVYLDNNNEYSIALKNCDFETAKEIAETIGEQK